MKQPGSACEIEKEFRMISARTGEFDESTRAAIIQVCLAAHANPDFQRLFSFLPPDGLHVLGYAGDKLASHAVVTTRWGQPEGLPELKTAYVDAVSTSPEFQGQSHASAVMRRLAVLIHPADEIACL
jgi:hypothetical protein